MLAILKPFVLSALKSPKFKTFVVELLEKLVEQTDNELDDRALQIVKKGLIVYWQTSVLKSANIKVGLADSPKLVEKSTTELQALT